MRTNTDNKSDRGGRGRGEPRFQSKHNWREGEGEEAKECCLGQEGRGLRCTGRKALKAASHTASGQHHGRACPFPVPQPGTNWDGPEAPSQAVSSPPWATEVLSGLLPSALHSALSPSTMAPPGHRSAIPTPRWHLLPAELTDTCKAYADRGKPGFHFCLKQGNRVPAACGGKRSAEGMAHEEGTRLGALTPQPGRCEGHWLRGFWTPLSPAQEEEAPGTPAGSLVLGCSETRATQPMPGASCEPPPVATRIFSQLLNH